MEKSKWTDDEIKNLKDFYPTHTAKEFKEKFNLKHSIKGIQKKARELEIYKYKKWTSNEIKLLRFHWMNSNMKTLLSIFPNRNYIQLVNKATELKLHSIVYRKRKGSLDFLNNITMQSAYWWGFIMADGCLTKKNSLFITLSAKDKEHLQKLANYLQCDIKSFTKYSKFGLHDFVQLQIQDSNIVKKWIDLFEYKFPKTYNPPKLDIFYNRELFIYFFIGFIDGDGCIWRSRVSENNKGSIALKIENHKSWYNIFVLWGKLLFDLYNININVSINKRNFAQIICKSNKDLFKIYNYVNCCDYMDRKWHHVRDFVSL